ncbi:hypothetical protein [Promicromonospora sp. NPDC023987]|uniref:hypothetical protein n=1 Tax=Promicromonospora sp. NPDC023987 TaxID=3155360 RepID=UPI00340E2211
MAQELPDAALLVQSMRVLSDGLMRIARTYERYVYLQDEGDPETFSPGHFVLYSERSNDELFAIEEQYTGTDWSDPDRLPTSWAWHTRRVERRDGQYRWALDCEGEVTSADVVQLLERAEAWARQQSEIARQATAHEGPRHSDGPHGPSL